LMAVNEPSIKWMLPPVRSPSSFPLDFIFKFDFHHEINGGIVLPSTDGSCLSSAHKNPSRSQRISLVWGIMTQVWTCAAPTGTNPTSIGSQAHSCDPRPLFFLILQSLVLTNLTCNYCEYNSWFSCSCFQDTQIHFAVYCLLLNTVKYQVEVL
jgi:hypothetical protein